MIDQPLVDRISSMTEQQWMLRGVVASFSLALIVAICVECFL